MKKVRIVMYVQGIDVKEDSIDMPIWQNKKTHQWNFANLANKIQSKKDEMIIHYEKGTKNKAKNITFEVDIPSRMSEMKFSDLC